MLSMPAFAYLQVSSGSAPGTWCDSECTWGGCGVFRQIQCDFDCDTIADELTSRGDCTDDNSEYCYFGKTGNTYYYCDQGGEGACSNISGTANINQNSSWETLNASRHSVLSHTFHVSEQEYDICIIGLVRTNYGCAAGYYATQNTGTANIVCSPCPAGGSSDLGNTGQSGCYLRPGNFSDASGTGQYTANCYW